MKEIALTIITILCLGCSAKSVVKKPDKLISKETMVDIIYDFYVAQAIRNLNPVILEQQKLTPTSYIYQKYNIDSLQFAQNERYYASDVEWYEKMHDQVNDRLLKNKEAIDK